MEGHTIDCHVCEQWNNAMYKHDKDKQEGCVTHNFTRVEEQGGIKKKENEVGYDLGAMESMESLDVDTQDIDTAFASIEAGFREEAEAEAKSKISKRNLPKRRFLHQKRDKLNKNLSRRKRGLFSKGFEGSWKTSSTGETLWANVNWKLPKMFHFMNNYEGWEREAIGGS